MGRLELVPVAFKEAKAFVKQHHRHHKPPVGHRASVAAAKNGEVVGVVILGRPVSRVLDNGERLEVLRCCTDGTRNACSFLYGAAWRLARALGYRELITYILDDEPGTSLHAAGFTLVGKCGGGSWSVPSRPRVDCHPLQKKLKYMREL